VVEGLQALEEQGKVVGSEDVGRVHDDWGGEGRCKYCITEGGTRVNKEKVAAT